MQLQAVRGFGPGQALGGGAELFEHLGDRAGGGLGEPDRDEAGAALQLRGCARGGPGPAVRGWKGNEG
ncbi:hypothetical protein ACIA6C_27285 [Streptomyces sp. NPDC051578]|uniref:hypothetical protein n=1 Tax=Streptomyces sp. NPDC051578 TaxID=3365662 RepID=UPI0037A07646